MDERRKLLPLPGQNIEDYQPVLRGFGDVHADNPTVCADEILLEQVEIWLAVGWEVSQRRQMSPLPASRVKSGPLPGSISDEEVWSSQRDILE